MPITKMDFTEEDIQTLVANAVRAEHKLPKDHEVKTLVVVDRDEHGENPTITIHTEFDKTVAPTGGKKK
jgi:hypothetical protein